MGTGHDKEPGSKYEAMVLMYTPQACQASLTAHACSILKRILFRMLQDSVSGWHKQL